jgi:hypothetical protein
MRKLTTIYTPHSMATGDITALDGIAEQLSLRGILFRRWQVAIVVAMSASQVTSALFAYFESIDGDARGGVVLSEFADREPHPPIEPVGL